MKKLFILFLMLGTVAIVPPTFAATSSADAVEPQIRVRVGQPGNRRWNRRTRTYVRYVSIGRYRYRETVRVTYLPNGRTRTVVLNRVRTGRAW